MVFNTGRPGSCSFARIYGNDRVTNALQYIHVLFFTIPYIDTALRKRKIKEITPQRDRTADLAVMMNAMLERSSCVVS